MAAIPSSTPAATPMRDNSLFSHLSFDIRQNIYSYLDLSPHLISPSYHRDELWSGLYQACKEAKDEIDDFVLRKNKDVHRRFAQAISSGIKAEDPIEPFGPSLRTGLSNHMILHMFIYTPPTIPFLFWPMPLSLPRLPNLELKFLEMGFVTPTRTASDENPKGSATDVFRNLVYEYCDFLWGFGNQNRNYLRRTPFGFFWQVEHEGKIHGFQALLSPYADMDEFSRVNEFDIPGIFNPTQRKIFDKPHLRVSQWEPLADVKTWGSIRIWRNYGWWEPGKLPFFDATLVYLGLFGDAE